MKVGYKGPFTAGSRYLHGGARGSTAVLALQGVRHETLRAANRNGTPRDGGGRPGTGGHMA